MPRTATPVKTSRTARYQHLHDNLGTLDLTITKGRKTETYNYFVEDLGHDASEGLRSTHALRCFRLTKCRAQQVEGEPNNYDVVVDLDATERLAEHRCECLGFLRWNHCKHTESLAALIQAGKI